MVTPLCWPITYAGNDDLKGKEKKADQADLFFFFFQSFFIFHKKMLVEYLHFAEGNRNSWSRLVQCFHRSDKNEIHMHIWAMEYELPNFSDFVYK